MRSEPVVEADALGDLHDVGAGHLADVRDLVDEADPRREERVGRADDRRFHPLVKRGDAVTVRLRERADDDAVGIHEVVHGVPLGEELGIRDVADVAETARLECRAHLVAGADWHGALHDEDRAAIEPRQLVDHRPDAGEIGVARVRGRGVDADEGELGGLGRFCCVQREDQPLPVPFQQLAEARLEEGHLALLQPLDLLRDDVADRHFVTELREARGRDEADPARAEDSQRLPALRIHASYLRGRSPRAIAIIVSFESALSSVLTTQYVAPFSFSTIMWRSDPE